MLNINMFINQNLEDKFVVMGIYFPMRIKSSVFLNPIIRFNVIVFEDDKLEVGRTTPQLSELSLTLQPYPASDLISFKDFELGSLSAQKFVP